MQNKSNYFISIYENRVFSFSSSPDRIEDGDGFSDEKWTAIRNKNNHAVSYPLDPTRWWPHAGKLDDKGDETGGRCLFCVTFISCLKLFYV